MISTKSQAEARRISPNISASRPPHPAASVILLVIWTGTLAFYGLDAGFLYRTEALRALVARNMLHSGDYLVPTLYGETLLTKGPVMYAAIALASWPVGDVTTWSARIPAAVAMIMTALLVYWHLRRYVDGQEYDGQRGGPGLGKVGLSLGGAMIATCMIACNPMWLDKATSAEIDMLVVFWVALSLVCFFRAVDEDELKPNSERIKKGLREMGVLQESDKSSRRQLWPGIGWWIAALAAVALGTLTKWHAGVFFYATAIWHLWWTQRLRLLLSPGHLIGVAIGVVLVGGWALVVIERVGWQVLWATLWQQALPRLSPAHQHGERLWLETPLHPIKMFICGLPWSAFCGLAFWPRWYRRLTPRAQALVQTLHSWTWPSLVVFSLLPDHDSRHSMPLLTGLVALGAVACVLSLSLTMDAVVRRYGQLLLAMVLVGFSTLLPVGLVLAWWRLDGERFSLAMALGGAAFLILLAAWWASRRKNWFGVLAGILLVWLVGKIAFAELVVPVRSVRDPIGKAAILKHHIPSGETLYIFQAKDEGIMFYYGGSVVRVRGWEHLPVREHVYCLATPGDFHALQHSPDWRVVWQLAFVDEQGDPMLLALVQRTEATVHTS